MWAPRRSVYLFVELPQERIFVFLFLNDGLRSVTKERPRECRHYFSYMVRFIQPPLPVFVLPHQPNLPRPHKPTDTKAQDEAANKQPACKCLNHPLENV